MSSHVGKICGELFDTTERNDTSQLCGGPLLLLGGPQDVWIKRRHFHGWSWRKQGDARGGEGSRAFGGGVGEETPRLVRAVTERTSIGGRQAAVRRLGLGVGDWEWEAGLTCKDGPGGPTCQHVLEWSKILGGRVGIACYVLSSRIRVQYQISFHGAFSLTINLSSATTLVHN